MPTSSPPTAVVKTSTANKAALIRKTLDLEIYERELTYRGMLEGHPFALAAHAVQAL